MTLGKARLVWRILLGSCLLARRLASGRADWRRGEIAQRGQKYRSRRCGAGVRAAAVPGKDRTKKGGL